MDYGANIRDITERSGGEKIGHISASAACKIDN